MLEVVGLSKSYSDKTLALSEIHLKINKGIFGLLGPNGAGKSTLMQILSTTLEPDCGSVTFNGINVLSNPHIIRQQLGYLPQNFGVYPNVTAYNLLNHFAILKGCTNKKNRQEHIESLLSTVNLTEFSNKKVASFSGGMLQRFGIAQALIGNPKLLIVDEPTAGLDPTERLKFNNLLSSISEDITVILSTHIVEDVEELCSEVGILNNGKLVKFGSTQSLVSSLKGKIIERNYATGILPDSLSNELLYTYFSYGKKVQRFYCKEQTANLNTLTIPNLKDVYFSTILHTDK